MKDKTVKALEAVAVESAKPEPLPDEPSNGGPDGATCDICSGSFSTAEIVECVACGREVCQWCSEEGMCEECACNLGECPYGEDEDEADEEAEGEEEL